MKSTMIVFGLLFAIATAIGQNIHQQYSGKIGFYSPDKSLNNGLMIGADGITEFLHYDFFLNLSADLYLKRAFNFFKNPGPNVAQQQIFLIPLGAGAAYKLFEVSDADSRGYIGAGAGYYLYFYSVEYSNSSGGLLGGGLTTQSDSKSGGNLFFTVFFRGLVGKVFIEPKVFFASKKKDVVGSYSFTVNPSGFSIAIGFQY